MKINYKYILTSFRRFDHKTVIYGVVPYIYFNKGKFINFLIAKLGIKIYKIKYDPYYKAENNITKEQIIKEFNKINNERLASIKNNSTISFKFFDYIIAISFIYYNNNYNKDKVKKIIDNIILE